jgi:drug/metabolite transporter superfamily protein YnfA
VLQGGLSGSGFEEVIMRRERVLKVVLVVVGLLFCAGIYPLILMAKQDPALAMMMSLYATLGVFLLLASRNPSDHRSLIAFAAWSSFAHAGIMSLQALLNMIARRELIGSAVFILIGVALITLAPAKQSVEKASPVAV